MSTHQFDTQKLLGDLAWRVATGGMTWQQLGRETGMGDSAFTRLRHGGAPDAHNLVSLLAWLGATDRLKDYVIEEEP